MKCPYCGAEAPEGDVFCGECGRRIIPEGTPPPTILERPPGPPAGAPQPTKRRKAFPWVIVLAVLLGACVVCGGGTAAVILLRPTPTFTPIPTSTATPTSTPTLTPVPTSTSTPTPTPTLPPVLQPKVISLVFAPWVDDDGAPLDVTDLFPSGTTEVYCVFEYEGFAGIVEYEAVFYRDGQEDTSGTLELAGEDSGQTWVRRYDDDGLPSGEYALEIYVQGQLLARSAFSVLGESVLLEDDFGDDTSGWGTASGDDTRRWYEGGEFHILVEKENWYSFSSYTKESSFGDIALEVDAWVEVLPETGIGYGVVARRTDQDFYRFQVSDDGHFKIDKHAEDGWTALLDWTESEAIQQGTYAVNRLRAECLGQVLRFYVNGVFLDEVEDASLVSGQIGLIAGTFTGGTDAHVVFDNVVVYELQ